MYVADNHDSVLKVENVSRYFRRENVTALSDVSLSIAPAQIHSLLGPNGAGKTTLVNICAALLRPSSGQIFVDGIDAVKNPAQVRAKTGLVLGGELGFYPRATATENLLFFADIQNISNRFRKKRVVDVLEQVSLTEVSNRRVGTFSRGMKQRLHIARALLGEPPLLLLDEPTIGLDPDISYQIRSLIKSLAETGTSILLTSHQLAEVEELSDTISVLKSGSIVIRGNPEDIAKSAGLSVVSLFTADAGDEKFIAYLTDVLSSRADIESRPFSGRWQVFVFWKYSPEQSDISDLQRILQQHTEKNYLDTLMTRPVTLEEAYLATVRQ